MSMRFQADADFNQRIVKGVLLREPNLNFQSANQANLEGLSDLEVLAFASQDNRVLLSHDQRTMPQYFAQFVTTQKSSGIIIISQKMSIIRAIDEIIHIGKISEMQSWINRIAYLPLP